MKNHHEPLVIERTDWRITKAECSCGTKLELGEDSGSAGKQADQLAAASQLHKKDRAIERKKPV
jgi:hypothetical protein